MSNAIKYRQSSKCWLVLVACCIVDGLGFTLGTTGYSVFLTPIREGMGLSMTEAQLYNTTCMACTIISTFFGAKILRIGAGKVIAISSAMIIIGYNMMGFMPSVASIAIAGCLGGIAYPLLSIFTMPIIVSNWFHKRQGTWISVVLAMSGFGGFAFSPIATQLIADFGWQSALSIVSIIMVIPLLLGVFVIRENPLDQGILPHGATIEDVKQSAEQKKAVVEMPGVKLAEILKSPSFFICGISLFAIGLTSGYAGNMNPIIQDVGYSAAIAGYGMSAMSLGNLVCKPIIGVLRDRFGAILSGLWGYSMLVIGFLLLIAGMGGGNTVLVLVAAFVAGLGGGSGLVMPSLYTKDAFGSKDFDRIYSIQMGIRAVGCAVAAPLAGIMFDASGGYFTSIVFWIIAGICAMSFGTLAVKRGRRLWGASTKGLCTPERN